MTKQLFTQTKKKVAIGTAILMSSSIANAALDAAVTTELDNVKANIIELGGLLIALAAVALGIKWLKAMFF